MASEKPLRSGWSDGDDDDDQVCLFIRHSDQLNLTSTPENSRFVPHVHRIPRRPPLPQDILVRHTGPCLGQTAPDHRLRLSSPQSLGPFPCPPRRQAEGDTQAEGLRGQQRRGLQLNRLRYAHHDPHCSHRFPSSSLGFCVRRGPVFAAYRFSPPIQGEHRPQLLWPSLSVVPHPQEARQPPHHGHGHVDLQVRTQAQVRAPTAHAHHASRCHRDISLAAR